MSKNRLRPAHSLVSRKKLNDAYYREVQRATVAEMVMARLADHLKTEYGLTDDDLRAIARGDKPDAKPEGDAGTGHPEVQEAGGETWLNSEQQQDA